MSIYIYVIYIYHKNIEKHKNNNKIKQLKNICLYIIRTYKNYRTKEQNYIYICKS